MEPKFFLEPNFFSDPKLFLNRNFFEPKIFSNIFWTQNFFQIFFGPKIFSHIFWTQNFFQIFLGPKICLVPKFLGPNISFRFKNFFGPKFFLTKKDLTWFYGINLPNQNRLNQRLSKLNTLDLSLVKLPHHLTLPLLTLLCMGGPITTKSFTDGYISIIT